MKSYSITRRILLTVLLAQLVAASVLSVSAFSHERRTRLHALDTAMRGKSDSLLGAVQDAEDAADNVYVDPAELRLPLEDRWAVLNADGSLVGHSAGGEQLQSMLRQQDGIRDQALQRTDYRLLQRHALRIIDRAETGGAGLRRPVILLYASPRAHLVHEALESASYYILLTLLVSAATAVLVSLLLRRSLHPVAELGTAAEQVTFPQLLFHPPARVATIQELQPLVATLTRVVSGLRVAVAREQQFVGDAAHELKTAVAILRSTLQVIMLRTRSTEEYRAGLDRALQDTERMEALVQQMLTLARLEEAPAEDSGRTDLSLAAMRVLFNLEPLCLQREVHLRPSLVAHAVVCISTESAHSLLSNLVLNAIQHSPPASQIGVSITLQGDRVHLQVQDHGDGIDSVALPHIFERFFRADSSRARESGGVGLGLAICRSIVDRAGGTIDVQSAPGQGTTITVDLPRPFIAT